MKRYIFQKEDKETLDHMSNAKKAKQLKRYKYWIDLVPINEKKKIGLIMQEL